MIVLNTLFTLAMVTCYQNATFEPLNFNTKLLTIPSLLVLLLCPILGLLSACLFGIYKIFQISIYSLLLGLVLSALSIITMCNTVWYVTSVPLAFSTICYALCVIPITINQLVGASREELSFAIYWIIWPLLSSFAAGHYVDCYSRSSNIQYKHLVMFAFSAALFIGIYLLIQCFNHMLVTTSLKSNPVKLVVQVLNYARKHKFPEQCSAFTYWEEQCPSRIDFGKDKYGGPFTVEEVEDVKTALKLIPLISCVMSIVALETAIEVELYSDIA